MRSMVERAMERIVAHIESLPEQPVSASHGGEELARSLAEPLPEAGTPFDELLDLIFDRAVPCSFNTASPGYLAYIPSGGIFHSAVADLIADSVNRYVGVWLAAPGLAQLEINVVRWLCEMVGYPPDAGGVLLSGGSLANLTAVVTARQERLGEDFLRGTLYTSDQTHHSVLKAAVLAGFPARNVRSVPCDEGFRIRTDELERRIGEDHADGLQPFLIAGNAGTTNTGAVDDLGGLADVAARHQLWLHVDAAYGGFFALTERGRRAMRGLERADSITLDPHKGLFLPYGTGSLLVRDVGALKRTHSIHADYMPAMRGGAEMADFCEISPELSRELRGLRAWLPIKMHGIGVFRWNLDEKLDLVRWATEELRTIPDLEIVAEPQLSLVVFRLRPEGAGREQLDQLNRDFMERINQRQRVMLTGTVLDGSFALRICVLSFRTHQERMEMALEDIRAAAQELAGHAAPAATAAACGR
ncbi:MAG: aminotransferase class I/II-fold pyridoxal phosphate-dependent enzyme [bacterium]|nr:aminotransferase class I/II-fold pyridoxal phosphate-dependent enzyme [bacterium]